MSFSVKPSSMHTEDIVSGNLSTVANNNVTYNIPYRVSTRGEGVKLIGLNPHLDISFVFSRRDFTTQLKPPYRA